MYNLKDNERKKSILIVQVNGTALKRHININDYILRAISAGTVDAFILDEILCGSLFCNGNGICNLQPTAFICACNPGFTGTVCSESM